MQYITLLLYRSVSTNHVSADKSQILTLTKYHPAPGRTNTLLNVVPLPTYLEGHVHLSITRFILYSRYVLIDPLTSLNELYDVMRGLLYLRF